MNTRSRFLAVLLTLALTFGVGLIFTACSSTDTRESTGEYIDDTVITTKVKAALAADKTVSALAVNIETFKGTVQLSGFVNSSEEKAQAGVVARGVRGVKAVENNITVK